MSLDPVNGQVAGQRTYGPNEIPLDRVTADLRSDGVIASGIVERSSSVNMRDIALRLDGAGAPIEELWRAQDLHTSPASAADGAVAYGSQAAGVPDGQIVLRLPDGSLRTLLGGIIPRSVAFAGNGDVVAVFVGVGLVAPPEWQGTWLARFGRDASLKWRCAIRATTTDAPHLAVATDGTIVFTLRPANVGESVNVTWGQIEVSGVYSLVVLAASGTGEPRWARGFGDATIAYSAAIDPERGIALVAVAPAGTCPVMAVELLAFDASRRWRREFACGGGTIAAASAVAGRNAPIYVAGVVSGSFDFGKGAVTAASGGSPFVVRLVP
ncbi:MAG TPA: hypothetical protein VFK85_00235 [Anaeromyxobacteraceae bacterium]|nr:hypothetical protein [Anaeromyxobacteraceae bacterium]